MPYKLHSIGITVGAGSEIVIGDIVSQTPDLAPEFLTERAAGVQFPDHVSLVEQLPMIEVTTFALTDVLNLIGIAGLCLDQGRFAVYLQQIDDCGRTASGNVHRRLAVEAGILLPSQITVDHKGNAQLTIQAHAVSDGVNNAVAISDNQALPVSVLQGNRWTLGPVSIGALSLADYTRFAVDFGVNVQKRATQSDFDAKYVEVLETSPAWEITGIGQWFGPALIPYGGKPCVHSNTLMYLRKRDSAQAGRFVSSSVAEHIKFTLNGFAAIQQTGRATENQFAESTIRAVGQIDAVGNAPMTYTGQSTHPT